MTPGREKVQISKTSSNFERIIQNINPRKILGKVTKFDEFWMSY